MRYPFFLFAAICLFAGKLSAQFFNPVLPNINVPNAKIASTINAMRANIDLDDSSEGGLASRIETFEGIWGIRAFRTDSMDNALYGSNMFSQYAYAVHKDLLAKQQANCGDHGFHGSWECFGPDSIAEQAMGYVNTVWADDVDTNYILSGTSGGLFKTTNGGKSWHCITDNTILGTGVIVVTSIAVNPLNTNTIYLGTSTKAVSNVGSPGYGSEVGCAILKSFDAGQTWQQEVIQIDTSYADSIKEVQQVFFTPDSGRLYAFSSNKIYTRQNDNLDTWKNITPPGSFPESQWKNLQFVPGDPNHFFVCIEYQHARIFESNVAEPTASDWTDITTGFSSVVIADSVFGGNRTITDTSIFGINISLPVADSLYAIFQDIHGGVWAGLFVYKISSNIWYTINNRLPYNQNPSFTHFQLEVSKANTTNNSGKRVIYYGNDVPFESVDGGVTFDTIGRYEGNPTHADVRDLFVQKDLDGHHGTGNALIIANDGGVSRMPTGVDATVTQALSSRNINGRGLTCGQFWGMSTSEEGGLAIGGMMHDGMVSYEHDKIPQWKCIRLCDCGTTVIENRDRTKGFVRDGNSLIETIEVDRQMDSFKTAYFPTDAYGAKLNSTFHGDELNNQYACLKNVHRKVPDSVYYNSYGFTRGLSDFNIISKKIETSAMSSYDNTNGFTGYIVYDVDDTIQRVFKRNSFDPNFREIDTRVPYTPAYPISGITLDPLAPERVWVSIGGINWWPNVPTINRVQYSPDWGTTWIDISNGLPRHGPVSNIIFQEGANRLFASTDIGIYTCDLDSFKMDSTLSSGQPNIYYNHSVKWDCFSSGKYDSTDFPNTYVTELKINYCEAKLYASTYGRSIWRTDLYENGFVIPPHNPNHITTNTTWDEQKYLTGNVLIDSNVTLTITDPGTVIHMPRNGVITLERGARLVVQDSAVITNSCEECFWWGIVAKGTKTDAQLNPWAPNPKHAVVTMNNGAVLENARHAVSLFDFLGGDGARTGGILHANNSSFRNNKNSLFFNDYKDFDNKSVIYNCTFSVDNEYKGHDIDYPFGAHVVMVDVTGVDFIGCSFYNTDTFTQNHGRGTGILTANAGFTVKPICSGFPCTYQNSIFEGFRNGITIGGSYDDPTTAYITHADFDYNTVGVRVIEKNDVTVINSNFSMGYGLPSSAPAVDNVLYEPNCPWNIGIYTNSASRFTIEENNFTGHIVPSIGKIGIVTVSSGTNDNTIYKCNFDHLENGCVSSRVNGQQGGSSQSERRGLRYKCNTFSNNGQDIHISASPNYTLGQSTPGYHGVAPDQGGTWDSNTNSYNSAGNTFAVGATHILNEAYSINYSCSGGSTYPSTSVGLVIIDSFAASNSCPSKYDPDAGWQTDVTSYVQSISDIKSEWSDIQGDRTTAITTLNGQIDNGSTSSLLGYISGLSPTPRDASSLKSTLLGYSPYLSTSVVIASFNIITNNTDRASIVTANPDLLREDEYYYYLNHTVSPPFGGGAIASFNTARNTISARGESERKISLMTDKMSDLAKQVILYCKLDTTRTSVDSLPVWYRKYNTIDGEYSMVGHYFSLGDTTRAQELLDSIPIYYSLSDSQQKYYDEYSDLFAISKGVIADGRPMTAPTSGEISAVNYIIDHGMHEIGVFSQKLFGNNDILSQPVSSTPLLTCFDDGYVQERKAPPPPSQPIAPLPAVKSESNNLTVSPNPARDNVLFKYDVPNATELLIITVHNSVGQMVKQFALEGNKGSVNWDTERVQAGTYIYKLSDGVRVIATGKLVIVK